MSETDALIHLLENESPELPQFPAPVPPSHSGSTTAFTKKLIEKIDDIPVAELSSRITLEAQKRKLAFLLAKDVEELRLELSVLSLTDYMDYFVKLAPKELQVKAQFDVRSLVAELGPIPRGR